MFCGEVEKLLGLMIVVWVEEDLMDPRQKNIRGNHLSELVLIS